MAKINRLVAVAAVTLVASSTVAQAQQKSIVGSQALDAAVASAPAGDRAVVTSFLAAESTRQAASQIGVSTADLTAGVAALDDAKLSGIAQRISANDSALAGGANTVVLTTTTLLIIALLIIILVSV